MGAAAILYPEEIAEVSHEPGEEEVKDLAFNLWRRGSCPDSEAEEQGADAPETVGSHASCL